MSELLHTIGRVTVRSAPAPKHYRIRYTDGFGKTRERTASTERRALEIARALDVQLSEPGGALQPGVPFKKLVSDWSASNTARGWSARQHDSMLSVGRTHLIPEFGATRCSDLTSDMFNRYLAKLRDQGYSDSLISAVRQCIKGACEWGVEKKVWAEAHNPAKGKRVKLPKGVKSTTAKVKEKLDRSLLPSDAQVKKLIAEGYKRRYCLGLMLEVASVTGLRYGELAALTVGDFDAKERELSITKTLTESATHGVFVGPPKSTASWREVLVPPAVAAKLKKFCHGKGADELLFTSPTGLRLRHSNFMRNDFKPCARRAGLADHMRMHSLRHYCITTWVDDNLPAAVVAKLAGHSSNSFVQDRYYGARSDWKEEMKKRGW